MTTAVFSHEARIAAQHARGHPEQVARMAAVARGLAGLGVDRREAPLGVDEDILRCHPAGFIERITRRAPQDGIVQLDPDTWMSPGTLEAALRAVGGVCAAVDLVVGGGATNAFVAHAPAGPPCRARNDDGVLPVRERWRSGRSGRWTCMG